MIKKKAKKIKFYEVGNPNILCINHKKHSLVYMSYDFEAKNHEIMNRYAFRCTNCGKYFLDYDKFKELKECCNKYKFVPNDPRNKALRIEKLQKQVNKRFNESKIYVLSNNHAHLSVHRMPVTFGEKTIRAFYCEKCDKFFCMYDDIKNIGKLPSKFVLSKTSLKRKEAEEKVAKAKLNERKALDKIVDSNRITVRNIQLSSSKKENNMFNENEELRVINRVENPYFIIKRCGFKYISDNIQRLVEMNVYIIDDKNYILEKDYIKNSVYGTIKANIVGEVPSLPKRDVPKNIINTKNVTLYVKTSNRKCINGNHQLNDLKMSINLLNDSGYLINKSINVFNCPTCNINYIYDDLYYNLVKYGQPTCLIVDEIIYRNVQNKGYFNLSTDSILTLYGYNVNQNKDLSTIQRQNILKSLIDTKIVKRNFAIEHIKFLINSRKSRLNHKVAVARWREDVAFLENYTSSSNISDNTIEKIIIQRKV